MDISYKLREGKYKSIWSLYEKAAVQLFQIDFYFIERPTHTDGKEIERTLALFRENRE